MFASGQGEKGRPRVESTVCPSRVLSEDPSDPVGFVAWWLEATRWDSFSGTPGLPEWPRRGGLLRQAAVVVEAVTLLREEWSHVKPKPAEKAGKAGRGH